MRGAPYNFMRWLVRGAMSICFPVRVHGKDNIPKQGPAILYSNHRKGLDPVFVCMIVPRPVHFMAKIELYDNRFVGWLLKCFNAFPVTRGKADLKSFRTALKALGDGELLGIFPEGTRQHALGDDSAAFHLGTAWITQKSRVPVIPIYIGPYRRFRFVHYHIGRPLDFFADGMKPDVDQINEMLYRALTDFKKTVEKTG